MNLMTLSRLAVLLVAADALLAQPGQSPLAQALSRISEEAEMFARLAPNMLAEETLEQRALKAPPRFRPRIGAAAAEPPKIQFQTREIQSEYGYSALKDSPGLVHEFLISVPAGGGYGLPAGYFLLQGLLVLAERRWSLKGRLWTLFWLLAPAPMPFHPWFVRAIIDPLM